MTSSQISSRISCFVVLGCLISSSAANIIFGGGWPGRVTPRPTTRRPATPAGPLQCLDPRDRLGTCLPFKQCPALRKFAVERNVAYLQASLCPRSAGQGIQLCCPNASPPPTKSVTTTFKSDPDCGLTDFGAPGRIVGGESVHALGDLPWMTALEYADLTPPFQCGGAVITPRWIMTAAHCITPHGPTSVRVGDLNLASERDDDGLNPPQNIAIERAFRHQDFRRITGRSLVNDIALLKLSQPIKFSDVARPICIPESGGSQPKDREVMVAGWGLTVYDGAKPSDHLQYETINMSLPGFCSSAYSKSGVTVEDDKHVCASGNDLKNLPPGCTIADLVDKVKCQRGRDSCKGDSGGPLMSFTKLPRGSESQFRAQAVGIVSFAIGCSDPRHPGVYTRVDNYLDWMGKTIADNSS